MKSKNFYDILIYVFIFALAYVLGIHSAMPREVSEYESVNVRVRLGENEDSVFEGETCFVDKATSMKVLSCIRGEDGEELILECEGIFLEAGFLSSGGKYLCANQPITLMIGKITHTGRIIEVLRI